MALSVYALDANRRWSRRQLATLTRSMPDLFLNNPPFPNRV
jgi:hypothetical protein